MMNTTKKYSKKSGLWLCIALFLISNLAIGQEMSVVSTASDAHLAWGNCPDFMPKGCAITVLHGDPAKPNVDVLFKIPTNYVVPKHKHSSAERMILISGLLEVQYEGERPKRIKAGSYAYGPANKPHVAKCIKGPCVLFIAFEAPLDAIPVVTTKN